MSMTIEEALEWVDGSWRDGIQWKDSKRRIAARTIAAAYRAEKRITNRLPKLKDNETAYPGRSVLVMVEGKEVLGEVAVDKYANMLGVRVYHEHYKQGNGGYSWHDLEDARAEKTTRDKEPDHA